VIQRQGRSLVVLAREEQIEALAREPDVSWIENFLLREKHNEYGGQAILGAQTANGLGYDGSTQTVAVADTGIGGGTAATAHPDIPASRVANIFNWPGTPSAGCYSIPNDGAKDVDSGHGTHVSGSVLSDGDASGKGKGTAPGASLLFQAVENYLIFQGFCSGLYANGYYLIGLPADLTPVFQQAYDAGARVHSNSWGSSAAGEYTQDSQDIDDFIW
jgi:serine protease AprX